MPRKLAEIAGQKVSQSHGTLPMLLLSCIQGVNWLPFAPRQNHGRIIMLASCGRSMLRGNSTPDQQSPSKVLDTAATTAEEQYLVR